MRVAERKRHRALQDDLAVDCGAALQPAHPVAETQRDGLDDDDVPRPDDPAVAHPLDPREERQTLAVLSPMILHDTGLSIAAFSDAVSAFSIAYMIGNPLWGSLLDRIGLRIGMLLAVGVWTLASVSHA